MNTRRTALLLAAWALAASAGRAAAQVPTSLRPAAGPVRVCPEGSQEIKVPPSVICLEFNDADVLVGSSNIPLTLTIKSLEEKPLKLVEISLKSESQKQRPIRFEMFGEEELSPGGGVIGSVYRGRFSIDEDVEPGNYDVSVKLKYASNDPPPAAPDFQLKVGGAGGVKLADNSKPITCMTGETKRLYLEIKNTYRDYPVHLRRVTITSDPSELVPAVNVPVDMQLRRRKEVEKADVAFNVKGMQLKDWIFGLGEATLHVEFEYEDDQKRVFKARDSLSMVVRPSVAVLFVAISLGVLAGTVVKTDLKRLQKEGYITKKQKAFFISGTIVIGLIAAVVALIGEVQVSVFKFNGSYDSPKVLFLIGLAATLAGPPLLYGLLKSSKAQGGAEQTTTPTQPAGVEGVKP